MDGYANVLQTKFSKESDITTARKDQHVLTAGHS